MELRAKKSLGQNFLNSPSAVAQIVGAANVGKGNLVLEIGPGTGILTQALLKTGASVVAIEKDDRAIGLLSEKFKTDVEAGTFRIIHGDALEVDLEKLSLADGKYSLVANIPYYITGMILARFLEHTPCPFSAVLLVQKEVAERIVARDGKESILSISVKVFGSPRIIAKVPRGAFVPAPNVDSAIMEISGISGDRFTQKNLDIGHFFKILKAGFAHKRKLLRNNLKEANIGETSIKNVWASLQLDEKRRAEELDTEKWLELASLLN